MKRKVHAEAIEMISAREFYNESQSKVNLLENRIRRLIFEDERAKKLTRVAEEKATKLLYARERH